MIHKLSKSFYIWTFGPCTVSVFLRPNSILSLCQWQSSVEHTIASENNIFFHAKFCFLQTFKCCLSFRASTRYLWQIQFLCTIDLYLPNVFSNSPCLEICKIVLNTVLWFSLFCPFPWGLPGWNEIEASKLVWFQHCFHVSSLSPSSDNFCGILLIFCVKWRKINKNFNEIQFPFFFNLCLISLHFCYFF